MNKSEPVMVGGRRVGKLRASWLLFKETWRYLQADRELLLLPVLAVLMSLVLFGFLVFVFVLGGGREVLSRVIAEDFSLLGWLFIFGCYVIAAFTLAVSQAGISHTVYTRAHSGDATLLQSLGIAFSHWPSLLLWSMITSTVGVLLQMVVEKSRLLGRLVAFLLGSAWSVLTYFVVPAMVIDKKTAFESISKSTQVFKSTWGETIVSNITLGAVFLITHVLVLVSLIGLVIACVVLNLIAPMFVIFAVYIIWLFMAILIQSTMEGILKTLLYIYASESTYPANFSHELLEQMLVRQNISNTVSAVPVQVPPFA